MFLDLFLITIIIVYIIDLSGFIEELEKILSKWLNIKAQIPKPISCSLCMTWWTGLIYLIIFHKFTLIWICCVALLSFLTPFFYNALLLIRDILNTLIDKLYKFLRLE